MPAYCAASGCNARHHKGDNISFHSFPHRDPALLSQWLRALGREDLEPKSHHRVCSRHFKPSCFYAGLDRPCLRPDAVPTDVVCSSPKRPSAPAKGTSSVPAHNIGTRAAAKRPVAGVGGTVLEKCAKVADEAPRTGQQPLPKKQLFQLRHEASQLVAIQPKDKGGTASAAAEEGPDPSGTLQPKPDAPSKSASEPQPKEEHAQQTTNGIVAALSLHSYCGVSEDEQVTRLKNSLRLAKKKLIAAERKLKRKNDALAQLQATVDDLKAKLLPLEREGASSSGGQRFSVSERLPQDLFRDWHENAGRVPHARRYSAPTLHFAAELHSCSRAAYEHVARWVPMPTLYVVRKNAAAATDMAAATGPLPAARFASSLPRKRNPTTEETGGDASTVYTAASTSSPAVPIVVWKEEDPMGCLDACGTTEGSSTAPDLK